MSTVFGRFSFTHSGNAEIDFDGLAKALNKFTWSDTEFNAKWTHSANDETFKFESDLVEDPTALPKIYVAEIEDSATGETLKKTTQEMTSDDHQNLVDINGEHVDLNGFAEQIKPFIRSGSIQISCDADDGKGLTYWEQITVNADGTGIASWHINRENGKSVKDYEKF